MRRRALLLGFSDWAPSVKRFVALVKVHIHFSIAEGSISCQVGNMVDSFWILASFYYQPSWCLSNESRYKEAMVAELRLDMSSTNKSCPHQDLLYCSGRMPNLLKAKARSVFYYGTILLKIIHPPGGQLIMLNSCYWMFSIMKKSNHFSCLV